MLTILTGIRIIHQVLDLTGISVMVVGAEVSIQDFILHFIMVAGIVPGITMDTVVIMEVVIILMEVIMVVAITLVVTGEWDFMVADTGPEAITVVVVLQIIATGILEGKIIQVAADPIR